MTDFYTTGITNSTGKVKLVDSDGTVYDLDVKESIGGGYKVVMDDPRGLSLLEQILTTLKKIEYHLSLGTDTDLKDQDV